MAAATNPCPAVRERVRRMLAGEGIEWWGERRSLPVSIGEASSSPTTPLESLIERAQKSLDPLPPGERARPPLPTELLRKAIRELGMFAIIGIVVVFGCIVAGYLMEHGNFRVLIQPAELIIIGGAAVGTLLSPTLSTSSRRLQAESAASSAVRNSASKPISTL